MMATPFVAPVTVSQVGNCFVNQYYHVLQNQPHLVHRFYTDASSMFRTYGDKKDVAVAMLQIHSLVMSLNFTNFEIKMSHSVDSWNGGVLVTVNGSVQMKDFNERKKFVETFFLAPQEKGYFVLNDIFHLLDNERNFQLPETVLSNNLFESEVNASNSLSGPDYMLAREMQPNDIVVSTMVDENIKQQDYQADGRILEAPLEESTNSFTASGDDVNFHSVQGAAADLPKQTYASVVRDSRNQQGNSVVHQNMVATASEWQTHPSQEESYPASGPTSDLYDVQVAETIAPPEGERSVYVRNLPVTISSSDIEVTFKSFGRIKPDGIFIRSRKDVGVCYAFVEFEDATGVQNAIQASSVFLGGRQVFIEARRGASSLSRGQKGRGRGRFSGQSFARGNGIEMDYNNRTRWNDYPQASRGGNRAVFSRNDL